MTTVHGLDVAEDPTALRIGDLAGERAKLGDKRLLEVQALLDPGSLTRGQTAQVPASLPKSKSRMREPARTPVAPNV